MKTLYLIGGTMGVGKTTVCNILKRKLGNTVFLDGDWCWDLHPFVVTQATKAMVMDNIHAMLTNFLGCPEIENILFCWVMHQQDIIDEVLSGLPLEGVKVVNLSMVCGGEELKRRLEGDVAKGIRREDVIARSLERLPLYEFLQTTKIDTAGLSPKEIAEKILEMRKQP